MIFVTSFLLNCITYLKACNLFKKPNYHISAMDTHLDLSSIHIRTMLLPGDLSYLSYRQAKIYAEEYGFGVIFESYLGAATHEFYQSYDPKMDRVWICEHEQQIIGAILLMHRSEKSAQLRYFYLEAPYRQLGLGKKLMGLFMAALQELGYQHAYLWTINELPAAAALYMRYGFQLTEEKESDTFGRRVLEQRFELSTQSTK
jgi:peptidyl-dipeptidase Dcp